MKNFGKGESEIKKIILYFEKYWIFSSVFLSVVVSAIITRFTVIDNSDSNSHISVLAGISFWFWLFYCCFILVIILLQKKFEINTLIAIFLALTFSLVNGINLAGASLALRGTPLTFADVRGDLGVLIELAEKAKNTGFSTYTYPPIYVSLIGNFAKLLNFQVIELFKYADLIIIFISPILLYLLFSKFIPKWSTLFSILILTTNNYFTWKNLALYLFVGQMFLIIKKRNLSNTFKSSILNYFLGVSLGFFSLIYYGYLWWSILALIFFSILTLVVKPQYNDFQLYIFLGMATLLAPYFGFRIVGANSIYLLFGVVVVFLCNLYSKFLRKILIYLIPISLILALSFFETGDTWMQGSFQIDNISLNFAGFFNLGNFLLLLIILVLILFPRFFKDQSDILLLSISLILSSLFLMLYFASRMQTTGKVELWPRALFFIGEVFNLTLFLLIPSLVIYIYRNFFADSLRLFQVILITVFIYFSLSNTLIYKINGLFPTFSNGAWFAHQACSNPHEDPMLAKVFETKPDIQYFLRFNCSEADWPYIKVAYNGVQNMLRNPNVKFYSK